MANDYQVLDAHALGTLQDYQRDFALDVLEGLSERPKHLPSKYFYDDAGSRYFQQIMDLDEYYLTRCERTILTHHREDILGALEGTPFNLVDLGAGDGRKTALLLEHVLERGLDCRFVPIDISEGAMQVLVRSVQERLPGIVTEGLVSEYADGLHWLGKEHSARRNLVLFLGSNIGNFNRARARAFLRRMWNELRDGDYVLIGFDLKKDIEVLLRAYNDSHGVTAAFNLNLLTRINRELAGNFDVEGFRHFGTYDVFSGAMTSYLVSRARQEVYVGALQHAFEFEPWEPIHTEYSYKYLDTDISSLAADTGFQIMDQYYDSRRWFVSSLWRVHKRSETESL